MNELEADTRADKYDNYNQNKYMIVPGFSSVHVMLMRLGKEYVNSVQYIHILY